MDMNQPSKSSKKPELFKRSDPPHLENAPALHVENLTVRYESGVVLDDISFSIHRGERVAVVGPNGAGKSTLFKAIVGVLKPTRGEVRIHGYDPVGHICIAYVPQRNQVDWSFPVSVADVVMMGRIGKLGFFRQPGKYDWNYVHEALNIVNLGDMADRQISQLSGGQQQRMFIARALVQEAELMLMDEPLTGLDVNSQEDIFKVLEQLRQRGVSVMVALHDLKLAAEQFDRVMLLNKRLIGFGKPEEVFESSRLLQAYEGRLRVISTDTGDIRLGDTCCGDGDDHDHA
jgi:ABC-type Mn2+/Zn2+ transport system ATPase subunit